MKRLERLLENIVSRANVNLRQTGLDVGPYVHGAVPPENYAGLYAFYAITTEHPLYFDFHTSSLAGSYFLGRCAVKHSVLYKCDVRGDELKTTQTPFCLDDMGLRLHNDELIRIEDSFLHKTLIHNYSHDPEFPEEFPIKNTVALSYANIHGAPVLGSFLGPFATIDLTTVQKSCIGAYAYVQAHNLQPGVIPPGRIWIRTAAGDEFRYDYDPAVLARYIAVTPGARPKGVFMDFMEDREHDFDQVFGQLHAERPEGGIPGSFVSRYAVVKGETGIGENVLVAQRAYVENAHLGKGVNVQENGYAIDAALEGNDVMAHGAKLIGGRLGHNVFVGFNAFLRGTPEAPLAIGADAVVLPHTIIDLTEPVNLPAGHVVWGYVSRPEDLPHQSLAIEDFARLTGTHRLGAMTFSGNGERFIRAFQARVRHILADNGAYFDGQGNSGHAQKTTNITYNCIQPYAEGGFKGIYPNMRITPLDMPL